MWTPTTRRQHSCSGLRYETGLTDAEWTVLEPLMLQPASCGRLLVWTVREILKAIFYVLRGVIAWWLMPKDLPLRSTTYGYFSGWRDDGLLGRINHHLVTAGRERVAREALPSAAVLDSHSSGASGCGHQTTESAGLWIGAQSEAWRTLDAAA